MADLNKDETVAAILAEAIKPGAAPVVVTDDSQDAPYATRMACGDILTDAAPIEPGTPLLCPRHGETTAAPEMNGCPHSRNPDDCDDCWRDADNAAEIKDLIAKADDALVQALTATGKARRAIEDLMSNRVYDIELAEGTEGPDAVAELNRAGLSLRHAHRILAARKRLDEEG